MQRSTEEINLVLSCPELPFTVVPDGDIGALAETVRTPFEEVSKPNHPFGDDYDAAIMNGILACHS